MKTWSSVFSPLLTFGCSFPLKTPLRSELRGILHVGGVDEAAAVLVKFEEGLVDDRLSPLVGFPLKVTSLYLTRTPIRNSSKFTVPSPSVSK